MEKSLNKYKLNFISTLKYVKDSLEEVNILSKELLILLNFETGYFFTLLPNNANFQEINHFKCGGILPQFLEEEHTINGQKSTYSRIPNIENELSQLILKEVITKKLCCIMDDVSGSVPKDKSHPCFSDNYSTFYKDEIYSILTKDNISCKLILECLRFSTSFWHSLCILTTTNLRGIYKTLTLEKIKETCLHAELVMVEAYDGEGYVFWEKFGTNFFQ